MYLYHPLDQRWTKLTSNALLVLFHIHAFTFLNVVTTSKLLKSSFFKILQSLAITRFLNLYCFALAEIKNKNKATFVCVCMYFLYNLLIFGPGSFLVSVCVRVLLTHHILTGFK